MANRIKLAGTTMESFGIAINDAALAPDKYMDGIVLSTDLVSGSIYLNIDSGPGLGDVGALWVNPNSSGTWLRLGNQGSLLQASDGLFAYTTGAGSTGNGSILTLTAGTGSGSNKDGGNLIIAAGNASGGSGTDGNVTIIAGSATNVGDINLDANNWNATLLGELNINTDPGTADQVLSSTGPGTPPIWKSLPASLNVFAYRADTSSTSGTGITSGRLRWNNATQASATSLFLSEITMDGYDISGLFAVVAAGDKFYFQVTNNPSKYQTWTVSSITDSGTYYTFGVTLTDSGGGAFSNNAPVSFGLVRGAGAGSGTVTSVAALTLGTTGTDLSSTVANSTTTPVITLNVPTASATNRGALSAADWTTFNNKGNGTVTAVSVATANGFAGTSSGGATPALTLSTSVTGVLYGNGTSIAASNVTNDAQVKLSTVTTAGDLILATGNAAVTRLPIGTTGQSLNVVGGTAAWSSPYPIGTILQAPSAPTVGGTWLECDGSGVSQSTYSALYSAIGHAWTTYTTTVSSSVAPVTVALGTRIVWTGNKWLLIQISNTQTYTSTDGLTWSAAGTLPGTMTTPVPTVGPAGTVVIRNNGVSSTSYYTTNDGTTWATTTNASPISAAGYMEYNGTNWICFANSSRNTYHTTNPTTGSWTTNTNALPAAPGGNVNVLWDGTNWIIYYAQTFPPTTTSSYYVTSVSTGASGWSSFTTNVLKQGGAQALNGATTNKAGISMVASGVGPIFRTADAFTTITTSAPNPASAYVVYNGFSFILLSANWYNNATSTDGIKWNAWRSPTNFLNMSSVNGYYSTFVPANNTSPCPIDPATGKFTTISLLSGAQYSFLYSPATTLSTNFCLPSFIDSGKRWIRAL